MEKGFEDGILSVVGDSLIGWKNEAMQYYSVKIAFCRSHCKLLMSEREKFRRRGRHALTTPGCFATRSSRIFTFFDILGKF